METRSGSIFCRWSEAVLQEGHVVEGHTHNYDHTTFFMQGLWKVQCFSQVFDAAKQPVLDKNGNPLWHKVREVMIQGGAPGAWYLIEAKCKHTLTLVKGSGVYVCVYSHRTDEGEVTEVYNGHHQAYV